LIPDFHHIKAAFWLSPSDGLNNDIDSIYRPIDSVLMHVLTERLGFSFTGFSSIFCYSVVASVARLMDAINFK